MIQIEKINHKTLNMRSYDSLISTKTLVSAIVHY